MQPESRIVFLNWTPLSEDEGRHGPKASRRRGSFSTCNCEGCHKVHKHQLVAITNTTVVSPSPITTSLTIYITTTPPSQRGTRAHHLSVVGKRNSSVLVPVHLLHCDVHLEYYTNRSLGNPPDLRHSHIASRPKSPNHHIIKSLMPLACSIIPSSSMTMMMLAMTIQTMMITSPGL